MRRLINAVSLNQHVERMHLSKDDQKENRNGGHVNDDELDLANFIERGKKRLYIWYLNRTFNFRNTFETISAKWKENSIALEKLQSSLAHTTLRGFERRNETLNQLVDFAKVSSGNSITLKCYYKAQLGFIKRQ